jgi:hypothetical protein
MDGFGNGQIAALCSRNLQTIYYGLKRIEGLHLKDRDRIEYVRSRIRAERANGDK